jgi:hypothetical protein
MILLAWLGCQGPVPVERLVVDGVLGTGRAGVSLRFEAPEPCAREATTDDEGWVRVELCPGVVYEVVTADSGLRVLPTVRGDASELASGGGPWGVRDATDQLALVGGGVDVLSVVVDIRRIRPRGHDGLVPIPAVLPVTLPTWELRGRRMLLLPPGNDRVKAVPVVSTDEVPLVEGGPMQPWYTLGVLLGADGSVVPLPAVEPLRTLSAPEGTLWTGLPAGLYALWDGESERVPLLKVE